MKVARVFPRKTKASPDDELAFFGEPEDFDLEVDEIHISVLFSGDIPEAERLAPMWEWIAPVKIGGVAYGDRGADFIPGMYIKKGYVITSRGCPNNCWFCDVHDREGDIRELPITEGHNVLDSNLLACSIEHVRKVFQMLEGQKNVEFTGGLEAAILTEEHVQMLWDLRPRQMFFAYDEPADLEPLVQAGRMLRYADFTRSHLRCYVLIGYPKDDMAAAESRLIDCWKAGFLPMAMLWMDKSGNQSEEWADFQRNWARPALTKGRMRTVHFGHIGGQA